MCKSYLDPLVWFSTWRVIRLKSLWFTHNSSLANLVLAIGYISIFEPYSFEIWYGTLILERFNHPWIITRNYSLRIRSLPLAWREKVIFDLYLCLVAPLFTFISHKLLIFFADLDPTSSTQFKQSKPFKVSYSRNHVEFKLYQIEERFQSSQRMENVEDTL